MNRSTRIGNIVAFAFVIFFNFLANALPLGGQTTGEISDKYVSMFTPAGFTFAIWGVIYVALFGFIVRQAIVTGTAEAVLKEISGLFWLSCFANAAWIVAWHYDQLVLSMVFMLILLWALIKIVGHQRTTKVPLSFWDYGLLVVPFGLYFGWISVATIANVSILQSAYGLNDTLLSQETWTVLKLVAAGGAAFFFGLKMKDPVYLVVIAWAAYGISAANQAGSIVQVSAQFLSVLSFVFAFIAARKAWSHNRSISRASTTG